MSRVLFYHLTDSPLEQTLPMLLSKARAAGARIVVRGTDRDRMDWLDRRLWVGTEDGFPAHGLDGGPHDARQPILLTASQSAANDPACLMAIDGAAVSAAEAAGLERVCILFDGHDEAAVAGARRQWKELTEAGLQGQYWAQDNRRWVLKAESGQVRPNSSPPPEHRTSRNGDD